MKGLNCTKEEALQILTDDKDIDNDIKKDFDLSADQHKIAQQYTKTGTRKSSKNGSAVYKFSKPKEKKIDLDKEDIIVRLMSFVENTFSNGALPPTRSEKGHQFTFEMNGDTYEITLTRKRKSKK